MPITCAALGCNNISNRIAGISLHTIPETSYAKWKNILKITRNWGQSTRVCSQHFEELCFNRSGRYAKLIEGSIPTINLPNIETSINSNESTDSLEAPDASEEQCSPRKRQLPNLSSESFGTKQRKKKFVKSIHNYSPTSASPPNLPRTEIVSICSTDSTDSFEIPSTSQTSARSPKKRPSSGPHFSSESSGTKQRKRTFIKSIHNYSSSPSKLKKQVVSVSIKNKKIKQQFYIANRSISKLKKKVISLEKVVHQLKSKNYLSDIATEHLYTLSDIPRAILLRARNKI